MPHPALFGITNDALNLVVNLLFLSLVVIWIALVFWTYFDARRRIADHLLVMCSTLASLLFPYVGTIVYSILRPPEFIDDVRERELEMQAAELRLHRLDAHLCPHCDAPIEREFLRCPSCLRKLKDSCPSCTRPLDPTWTICPYCEADVAKRTPSRRPGRRRRSDTSEQRSINPPS